MTIARFWTIAGSDTQSRPAGGRPPGGKPPGGPPGQSDDPSNGPGGGPFKNPGGGWGKGGKDDSDPVGEALFAVGQFAVDFTTSGTVDLTIPDLGWTPKAAIFWGLRNTALDTVQDLCIWTVGATDGTDQFVSTFTSVNDVASTDSTQYGDETHVIARRNTNTQTLLLSAAFDSFIANGVKIDVDTTAAGTDPYYVNVMFFGGDDLQAKAVTTALPSATGSVSVNVGFEPDFVFFSHNVFFVDDATGGTFEDGQGSHGSGFATWDGSTVRQSCFAYGEDNAQAAGSPRAEISSQRIMVNAQGDGNITAENFGATGFDLGGGGASLTAFEGHVLALKLANNKAWCGVVDMPTSTGAHTFSEPGFEPKACIMVPTMMTIGGSEATDAKAGVYATSIFTADDEACIALANEAAADPTNVEQVTATSAISVNAHDGTAAFDATFSAFAATGPTLSFTAADGTTRKAILVAFGDG